MTLLDTNALIWLAQGHRRARPLVRMAGRLYLSPATTLELQLLVEGRRLRVSQAGVLADVGNDPRWLLDDPPSASWFARAMDESWTRDPFDRLLVAHARLRGWRLATGDGELLAQLDPAERLEL